METLEAIEARKSVRAFKPDPIPGHIISKILRAASASPSYTNSQPWEVAVVSGKKRDELAQRLSDLAKAKAPAAPDLAVPKAWPAAIDSRVHEHGSRRLATLGVARDDAAGREGLRLKNFEFYGAPCAVFLFMDASLGEWSIFDMGLFAQNLILAAHSLGVGSCLQASVTGYAAEIKKFLGMAEGKRLVIGISLGYEDDTAVLNTYRGSKQSPDAFTRRYE
ncbi:MAG: nitroreductase [Syntrophales bacterium]